MTREEAKQAIIYRAGDYLKPDGSRKGYICPICGSGSGPKGTGISTPDGVHFTCWGGGCFSHADIIDIIGQERGLTDYPAKLEAAAAAFNIQIDGAGTSPRRSATRTPAADQNRRRALEPEPEADYTEFYKQASASLEMTDYRRGISLETLRRFNVGFCPAWKHPKAPAAAPTSPRLIIPTGPSSYLARDTRKPEEIPEKERPYQKSKVGSVHLFNAAALHDPGGEWPIFIVEGEIDALSIMDALGNQAAAVALGSTSNTRKLLDLLREKPPAQPLILALDNDEPGRKATEELRKELGRLAIPCTAPSLYGEEKDANAALNKDRGGLTYAAVMAIEDARKAGEEAAEAEREELRKEAAVFYIQGFLDEITKSKNAAAIPTGFPAVDAILDGGLYSGLYVLGAISSLGKTTFALQMADNIAAAGYDVLIFSLEMARSELIAKSISRLTLEKALATGSSTKNAKTTRGIMTGTRYAGYSREEKQLIETAVNAYAAYAGNIFITEGLGNVTVETIREKVQRHISITGRKPVVLIDYLQIIGPADIRATDKQNTDKAVLELKRMSRDFSLPVIGISSFNRNSYTDPVNMAAFKESGAIEYSSDVLIGLQYETMDYKDGEAEQARNKRIRELMREQTERGSRGEAQQIQVKVLKNRNGAKGDALLDFYPMFNFFTDPERGSNDESWETVSTSRRS